MHEYLTTFPFEHVNPYIRNMFMFLSLAIVENSHTTLYVLILLDSINDMYHVFICKKIHIFNT